jgi:hypothetical protein
MGLTCRTMRGPVSDQGLQPAAAAHGVVAMTLHAAPDQCNI